MKEIQMVDVSEELTNAREKDAFALTKAAVFLDKAKQDLDNEDLMAEALNNNFTIWATIRETVKSNDGSMPSEISENLMKISDFVIKTCIVLRDTMNESTIDTLINVNFNIAEGLLTNPEQTAQAS